MSSRVLILNFIWTVFAYSAYAQKVNASMIEMDSQTKALADELAQKYIIIDGHVDLPYRLEIRNFRLTKEFIGIPIETTVGDFDFKRAMKGGLNAPFMSIYIPSRYQVTGGAKAYADSLINLVCNIAKELPAYYEVATSPDEIERITSAGKIALPMGMENGAPIGDDLANIRYFHTRGIRYITLTHAKDNLICDSSYDATRTWKGLSPFGQKAVKEMNKVGIMVDVSHVSDDAFFQVLDITEVPVIASHSSCRKFTPGFQRNMSDDMIQKLGENGGVVHVNFGSSFLDGRIRNSKIREYQTQKRAELLKLLAQKGLRNSDPAAQPIIEAFLKKNPNLFSDVDMVANHIDHIVKIAGIDHVGLGSDFDGVGDSLPVGLKDVSQYPNLIYVLLMRGYSPEDIEKICYKNTFRVWKAVERYATEQ